MIYVRLRIAEPGEFAEARALALRLQFRARCCEGVNVPLMVHISTSLLSIPQAVDIDVISKAKTFGVPSLELMLQVKLNLKVQCGIQSMDSGLFIVPWSSLSHDAS